MMRSAGDPMSDDNTPAVLRPMRESDLDAVAAIEVLVSPEPWTRSLLAAELDLPDNANHWLVVVDGPDQSIIGFGGTMIVADEAHIMNIAVHPDHRRRGIGRQLLINLLAAGRERGAVAATLEVRVHNRPAISLYSAMGFRRSGRRHGYYRDGTDALIMWRRDRVEDRLKDRVKGSA